jgi:hypothetical protein
LNILICFFFVFDIKNDFWFGLITFENSPMAFMFTFHGKLQLSGKRESKCWCVGTEMVGTLFEASSVRSQQSFIREENRRTKVPIMVSNRDLTAGKHLHMDPRLFL